MKDNDEETILHKTIAAWVDEVGLDQVREALAHNFKAELDDLGSLDTLDIARHGFTGAFEMSQEDIVEELAEWADNDPEEWKEDQESWEDQIHKLHVPKR